MNLGKLLEEVYVACGLQVLRRKATGGSATTVVDTGIANRKGDGYYAQGSNGGYILFVSETTDRLAPENQYGEVGGFTLSTATPTFTIPTLTDSVGVGDIYAVMKPVVQLYEMIGRINEGLRKLTETERVDATLITATDTRAYNLPLPLSRQKILQVETGSDANGWRNAGGLNITPSAGGTADQLVFSSVPVVGDTIRITYLHSHPVLSTYSDYVEKSIPDEVAIAVCVEAAFEMLFNKRPAWFADKTRMAQFQFIQNRAAQAKAEHPIRNRPAASQNHIRLSEI